MAGKGQIPLRGRYRLLIITFSSWVLHSLRIPPESSNPHGEASLLLRRKQLERSYDWALGDAILVGFGSRLPENRGS